MHHTHFLVREPLLDPQQRVVGYELSWQQPAPHAAAPTSPAPVIALESLLTFVASHVIGGEDGDTWLLRDKTLFLEAVPEMLSADALHRMPPARTVLSLPAAVLADPDTLQAVHALRAGGVGILLRHVSRAPAGLRLSSLASYVEVRFSGADVATQARAYAALKQSGLTMVARPVSNWTDFDACAALGLNAFVGKLHLTPRPGSSARGLNPAQTFIVQLMQMVRENADLAQIEAVLRRDPTLSYKLLRFINSAGFGAGREVQSLRQALTLLGYAPLQRWLTLLLATASSNGYSPVLLETAVVRGRLAELLARDTLGKSEAEQVFVAGMFSLLDRLLGMTMEEVLGAVQLPDGVIEALLTRSGRYGPYLALAEACELNSDLVAALAIALKLRPEDINRAHLQALAWAQQMAG
ncbi:histidine kinase [Duganella sp. Leaf126]|uniref:EAL and HDOD domain-containing protein n=1 Tax=Duganella sp. Leaf126 TaxID=1736266 RepID=UPI0006FCC48C|nr:HDOD domain-containing protein [Duganella sp. Leaf126]KQQ39995.1 histidine kinase [Duganella sp. Leaf126]